MAVRATSHRFDVPADYVEGDPAEPEPLTGGTLTLAPGGILFDSEGSGFAAELEELEGITVTGSRVRRPGFEATTRGYTKVALIRDGRPIIWEFSINRSDGTELRDMLNRVRRASGRKPLPYVEELNGFGERANTQATGEMAVLTPEAVRADAERRRKLERRKPVRRQAPRRRGRLTVKQRRIIFGAIGAMVLLEVVVPVLVFVVL
jgi:hypothetical protein